VYTPYSKKWKAALTSFYTKSYPVEKYSGNFLKLKPLPFPELEEIGFSKSGITFPERKIKQTIIEKYHLQRDIPGLDGTSRLSVHLRFGTVSIRKLIQVALKKNEKWLNELIWRDFYHMILWHFPHVVTKAFKPAYDQIEWRNDPDEFKAWCEGKTGYPIVDAGMRELNQTGYMHNRVRMIVASFLTKHLLIDWRWGEAYFAKKLLDFDLAANNGGWQWAAGSGCDAAPYFRVFNPYIQTEKFDSDRTYIKRWVPEVETPSYPKPIVDHAFARERVLSAYKVALES
jgi:deoxyribodipyrimidine photo-lyase